MTDIKCSSCTYTAIKIIGNCLQVTVRHNSQYHTTTIAISEIQDRINQAAMQALLDSRESVIVT